MIRSILRNVRNTLFCSCALLLILCLQKLNTYHYEHKPDNAVMISPAGTIATERSTSSSSLSSADGSSNSDDEYYYADGANQIISNDNYIFPLSLIMSRASRSGGGESSSDAILDIKRKFNSQYQIIVKRGLKFGAFRFVFPQLERFDYDAQQHQPPNFLSSFTTSSSKTKKTRKKSVVPPSSASTATSSNGQHKQKVSLRGTTTTSSNAITSNDINNNNKNNTFTTTRSSNSSSSSSSSSSSETTNNSMIENKNNIVTFNQNSTSGEIASQ